MDEKRETGEGILNAGWLTVPRGTGFFTGPPPVGERLREAEESEKVQYYPEVTREIEGRLWYFSTRREWFSQESKPLGEGDKRRFLDGFGTPIGLSKKK